MKNKWKKITKKLDCDTYEYRGYKIKVLHDKTCPSPWDTSDIHPPYIIGRATIDLSGLASKKFTWRESGQRDYTEGVMYVPIETWKKWNGDDAPYNLQKACDSLDEYIQELKSWMSDKCYGFIIYNDDDVEEKVDDYSYGYIGDDPWLNGMFENTHSAIDRMIDIAER